MARETTASKSFKPGMPVVFGGQDQRASANAASKSGDTGQKNSQKTLANWLESSWTPNMPIRIQQDGRKKRAEAPSSKSSTSSQSSIETYLGPAKPALNKGKGKQQPKKTRREATPPSSPDVLRPMEHKQQACYIIDSSFSAAEQGCSANATFDPDSSIEFIEPLKQSQRTKRREEEDPLSSALKHATLAQARLLEAVARRNEAEELGAVSRRLSTSSSNESLPDITSRSGRKPMPSIATRSYSNQIASPYRNAPLDFLKASTSAQPLQVRSLSSSSNRGAGNANRPANDGLIDWDDPVLTAPLRHVPEADVSDYSDLPEPEWMTRAPKTGPLGAVQPAKSWNFQSKSSYIKSTTEVHKPTKTVKKPAVSASTNDAEAGPSNTGMSKAEQDRLRKAGREAMRQKREERQQEREEEVEKWKRSLRPFSYDDGNWIVPKIWYFKSGKGGKSELVSVEGLKGQPAPESKMLEEVLESLEGPLGFDMEWEAYGRLNNNYKSQGRTSLIQVGDAKNIVLFQVGQSAYLPAALVKIIEDPDIVKLGVQISGDARKLFRDFSPKQSIVMKGLLELSNLAKAIYTTKWDGYHHLIGLQKLVALYLDRYLDKGDTRTSNWSKDLSKAQKRYAANDVFCSVLLYLRLVGTAEVENVPLDFAALIGDMVMGKAEVKLQVRKTAEVEVDGGDGVAKSAKRRVSRTGATPRQKEAWQHWHTEGKELAEVALEMNIKEKTVVEYVVQALWAERDLPYSIERLDRFGEEIVYGKERKAQYAELLGKPAKIYPDLAALAESDRSTDNQHNALESEDNINR